MGDAKRRAIIGALFVVSLAACSEPSVTVEGAGATAATPILDAWIDTFETERPEVDVIYDPVGSTTGPRSLLLGDVDFATTEIPAAAETTVAPESDVARVPLMLTRVVLAFNVRGLATLRLTRDMVVDIYAGRLTAWNDPRISALNPDVRLPGWPIRPIHRSDRSGTSYVFTRFLSASSAAWRDGVGVGDVVVWPTGGGSIGTLGMTQTLRFSPGTIGYLPETRIAPDAPDVGIVEIVQDGEAAVASFAETLASSLAATDDEDILRTDPARFNHYPIPVITYALFRTEYADEAVARATREFLLHALAESASDDPRLGVRGMPAAIRERATDVVGRIGIASAASPPSDG